MTARTRKRSSVSAFSTTYQYRSRPGPGWAWSNWSTQKTLLPLQTTKYEEMNDSISSPPYVDHNLSHTKFVGKVPVINGLCRLVSPGTGEYEYDHKNTAVMQVQWGIASIGHLSMSMSGYTSDYINAAMRANNPGNPVVDMAAFVTELRELPKLFSTYISKPSLPDAPIAYTFGIRPLMNDIGSILSLADSIDSRIRQLEKMTQGPVKERLSLGSETRSTSSIGSPSMGFKPRTEITTRRRAWAVKTASITTSKLTPPSKPNINEVRRLLLTDQSIVTLWELMPWSWLIDYFVDVQGFLAAHGGNRIRGYKVSSLCVCLETKTTGTISSAGRQSGWSGGKFTPGGWEYLTQLRGIYSSPSPVFPGLTPILTSSQVSTISQLGMALMSRRAGLTRSQ